MLNVLKSEEKEMYQIQKQQYLQWYLVESLVAFLLVPGIHLSTSMKIITFLATEGSLYLIAPEG